MKSEREGNFEKNSVLVQKIKNSPKFLVLPVTHMLNVLGYQHLINRSSLTPETGEKNRITLLEPVFV